VRERRTIGATAIALGAEPTATVVTSIAASGATTTTAPAGAVGTTSALLFVCCVGGKNMTVPAGWTVLANGDDGATSYFNSSLEWWVLAIDTYDGTEGRTFTFPDPAPSGIHAYVRGFVAHFSGGIGGHWAVAIGEKKINQALATMTTPPSGSGPYIQFGGLTGVYASATGPAGTDIAKGPAGHYLIPANGTYTGTAFTDDFVTRTPYTVSDTVTWGTLGAYGPPNSVSFAARWIP
jgi:hypothetical protein